MTDARRTSRAEMGGAHRSRMVRCHREGRQWHSWWSCDKHACWAQWQRRAGRCAAGGGACHCSAAVHRSPVAFAAPHAFRLTSQHTAVDTRTAPHHTPHHTRTTRPRIRAHCHLHSACSSLLPSGCARHWSRWRRRRSAPSPSCCCRCAGPQQPWSMQHRCAQIRRRCSTVQ